MKKFFGIVLALCLCITMMPSALAANNEVAESAIVGRVKSSEYEMLLELSATQERQFLQKCKSTAVSIEQAILEKASLPTEVLLADGYTGEQIAILKSYDGGPLEENPQLEKAMGVFEGKLSRVSYSRTSAAAKFSWEWVNEPFLTGTAIHDIVACAWRGTNTGNEECVMDFVPENSRCSITYNNGTVVYTKDFDIDVRDAQRNVEVKFPMTGPTLQAGWGQSGELVIAIKEENSINNMYSSTFIFAYGHMVFTISPSIDVSGSGVSLGLSCGLGTNEEFNKSIIIRSNGTTQEI